MVCARSFTAFPGIFVLLLGALTAARAHSPDRRDFHFSRAAKPNPWKGTSVYKQIGKSGVSAMQMSVVDDRYVIIFDKAEHNPLHTSDGNNAWSALLDTQAHSVRALQLVTNSFCAGESYITCPHLISELNKHFLLFTITICRWGMAGQRYFDQLWRQFPRKCASR